MRRIDWADNEANRLYDLVRDGVDDEKVTDAIADALRKGAPAPAGDVAARGLCEEAERLAASAAICSDMRVATLLRRLASALAAASAVVEAARTFRKADTGGGFNDRVECGKALDAALAVAAGKDDDRG